MYENIFSLKDKVVIVVGGFGLIGKEILRAVIDFGAKAICADIEYKNSDFSQFDFVKMNIYDEVSVKRAVDTVVEKYGTINGLVNVSYPRTKNYGKLSMEDMPWGEWMENVKMHLGGYFLVSRYVSTKMREIGTNGSIVNFGSTYGVVAPDFSIYEGTNMKNPSEYAAIKGGIIHLTKYLATYYAKYGIRFNVVSPGGVFDHQPEPFVRKYISKTPLGRMANPDDIVGAVIFLLSDASKYVTGQNILVDGGWTIW